MGAERSQWQFPANEVGKVIGWSDEASPSNPSASKGLVNKGPFVEPGDIANMVETTDTDASGFDFVIDEDDMASDSATKVPTQQSVKAYVDARASGDRVDVTTLGIDNTGLADVTATLITLFQAGGRYYFPDGDYLIAGAGADTGGVMVTVANHLDVLCEPGARFFTDNLDNDFFRLVVPSNGAGLPTGGIDVIWHGGSFDQSDQKNSTSVPFPVDYPPPNVGSSATCDALSIRGIYNDGSANQIGIRYARVTGATFHAGSHWQSAGGDGAIFMEGVGLGEIYSNSFKGCRDLGVYLSGDEDGDGVGGRIFVKWNRFENCMFGAAAKRALKGWVIDENYFDNCVRAAVTDMVIGGQLEAGSIQNNTMNRCGRAVSATYCKDTTIAHNKSYNAGALLEDNSAEDVAGFGGVVLLGCTGCTVDSNRMIGVSAEAQAAYTTQRYGWLLESFNSVDSTLNIAQNNYCSGGFTHGGFEGSGDKNLFLWNDGSDSSTTPHVSSLSATSFEVRKSNSSAGLSFMTPLLLGDGSAAAPILARSAGTTNGIFFGASKVGISANGTERFAVGTNGVGFFGATPVTRNAMAAASGTATRTTFDTATVTTAQLAERVKAMVDDFRAFGLFS